MMGASWNLPMLSIASAARLRTPLPQRRRSLRAHRRHPLCGRRRPFSCQPEPPTRTPARMGKFQRGSGAWTYRCGGPAQSACPPSARWERSNARLCRAHECVAQMRRGVQPLTQGYYYHPSRHSAIRSWPDGPTSSSHSSTSSARVGPPPWT